MNHYKQVRQHFPSTQVKTFKDTYESFVVVVAWNPNVNNVNYKKNIIYKILVN